MKQDELQIIRNLSRIFLQTQAFDDGGWLSPEIEVWTSAAQFRKPDMAYFSAEQIAKAVEKENNIPAFVIEIISKNDPVNIITHKIAEYFKAGVGVVWHIFPEQKMVYIFTSVKNITVCEGEDICSAAPVLPDFQISANAIFQ
ncbi:MAG: Uma2 family endonuclease [Saprospiraceae bacterium]|nr:Uma2 family endonuclease [Saprospiraceae bacterium]